MTTRCKEKMVLGPPHRDKNKLCKNQNPPYKDKNRLFRDKNHALKDIISYISCEDSTEKQDLPEKAYIHIENNKDQRKDVSKDCFLDGLDSNKMESYRGTGTLVHRKNQDIQNENLRKRMKYMNEIVTEVNEPNHPKIGENLEQVFPMKTIVKSKEEEENYYSDTVVKSNRLGIEQDGRCDDDINEEKEPTCQWKFLLRQTKNEGKNPKEFGNKLLVLLNQNKIHGEDNLKESLHNIFNNWSKYCRDKDMPIDWEELENIILSFKKGHQKEDKENKLMSPNKGDLTNEGLSKQRKEINNRLAIPKCDFPPDDSPNVENEICQPEPEQLAKQFNQPDDLLISSTDEEVSKCMQNPCEEDLTHIEKPLFSKPVACTSPVPNDMKDEIREARTSQPRGPSVEADDTVVEKERKQKLNESTSECSISQSFRVAKQETTHYFNPENVGEEKREEEDKKYSNVHESNEDPEVQTDGSHDVTPPCDSYQQLWPNQYKAMKVWSEGVGGVPVYDEKEKWVFEHDEKESSKIMNLRKSTVADKSSADYQGNNDSFRIHSMAQHPVNNAIVKPSRCSAQFEDASGRSTGVQCSLDGYSDEFGPAAFSRCNGRQHSSQNQQKKGASGKSSGKGQSSRSHRSKKGVPGRKKSGSENDVEEDGDDDEEENKTPRNAHQSSKLNFSGKSSKNPSPGTGLPNISEGSITTKEKETRAPDIPDPGGGGDARLCHSPDKKKDTSKLKGHERVEENRRSTKVMEEPSVVKENYQKRSEHDVDKSVDYHKKDKPNKEVESVGSPESGYGPSNCTRSRSQSVCTIYSNDSGINENTHESTVTNSDMPKKCQVEDVKNQETALCNVLGEVRNIEETGVKQSSFKSEVSNPTCPVQNEPESKVKLIDKVQNVNTVSEEKGKDNNNKACLEINFQFDSLQINHSRMKHKSDKFEGKCGVQSNATLSSHTDNYDDKNVTKIKKNLRRSSSTTEEPRNVDMPPTASPPTSRYATKDTGELPQDASEDTGELPRDATENTEYRGFPRDATKDNPAIRLHSDTGQNSNVAHELNHELFGEDQIVEKINGRENDQWRSLLKTLCKILINICKPHFPVKSVESDHLYGIVINLILHYIQSEDNCPCNRCQCLLKIWENHHYFENLCQHRIFQNAHSWCPLEICQKRGKRKSSQFHNRQRRGISLTYSCRSLTFRVETNPMILKSYFVRVLKEKQLRTADEITELQKKIWQQSPQVRTSEPDDRQENVQHFKHKLQLGSPSAVYKSLDINMQRPLPVPKGLRKQASVSYATKTVTFPYRTSVQDEVGFEDGGLEEQQLVQPFCQLQSVQETDSPSTALDVVEDSAYDNVDGSPWQEEQNSNLNTVLYGEVYDLLFKAGIWEDLIEKLEQGEPLPMMNSQFADGIILQQYRELLKINMEHGTGRYELGEQWEEITFIGSGVSGKCFLAVDKTSQNKFCVKVIELLNFDSSEIAVWASLDHDNIVKLLGALRINKDVYLLSEFIAGGTLKDFINSQPSGLSMTYVLKFTQDILKALAHMAEKHIVHEDLKADNIMLEWSPVPRCIVIDFGLSKELDSEMPFIEEGGPPTGGQTHLSPEKARSEQYDCSSDVWAAICDMLHMLSGSEPWIRRYGEQITQTLIFIIGDNPPPLQDIPDRPDITPEIRDLIKQGLTQNPENRPSAAKLLEHPAFKLLDTANIPNIVDHNNRNLQPDNISGNLPSMVELAEENNNNASELMDTQELPRINDNAILPRGPPSEQYIPNVAPVVVRDINANKEREDSFNMETLLHNNNDNNEYTNTGLSNSVEVESSSNMDIESNFSDLSRNLDRFQTGIDQFNKQGETDYNRVISQGDSYADDDFNVPNQCPALSDFDDMSTVYDDAVSETGSRMEFSGHNSQDNGGVIIPEVLKFPGENTTKNVVKPKTSRSSEPESMQRELVYNRNRNPGRTSVSEFGDTQGTDIIPHGMRDGVYWSRSNMRHSKTAPVDFLQQNPLTPMPRSLSQSPYSYNHPPVNVPQTPRTPSSGRAPPTLDWGHNYGGGSPTSLFPSPVERVDLQQSAGNRLQQSQSFQDDLEPVQRTSTPEKQYYPPPSISTHYSDVPEGEDLTSSRNDSGTSDKAPKKEHWTRKRAHDSGSLNSSLFTDVSEGHSHHSRPKNNSLGDRYKQELEQRRKETEEKEQYELLQNLSSLGDKPEEMMEKLQQSISGSYNTADDHFHNTRELDREVSREEMDEIMRSLSSTSTGARGVKVEFCSPEGKVLVAVRVTDLHSDTWKQVVERVANTIHSQGFPLFTVLNEGQPLDLIALIPESSLLQVTVEPLHNSSNYQWRVRNDQIEYPPDYQGVFMYTEDQFYK